MCTYWNAKTSIFMVADTTTFVHVNLDLTVFFVYFAFIFRLSFHQFFIVTLFPVINPTISKSAPFGP